MAHVIMRDHGGGALSAILWGLSGSSLKRWCPFLRVSSLMSLALEAELTDFQKHTDGPRS